MKTHLIVYVLKNNGVETTHNWTVVNRSKINEDCLNSVKKDIVIYHGVAHVGQIVVTNIIRL